MLAPIRGEIWVARDVYGSDPFCMCFTANKKQENAKMPDDLLEIEEK